MSWPDNVNRAQLRVEYFRGSGPGGQHRNKRDSCCRITHLPTGEAAVGTESKFQAANRRAAFRRLCEKLLPLMREAASRTLTEPPSTERVRTYHEKRGTVKDHRTGCTYNYHTVLDGGLDEILDDLVRESEL